MIDRVKKAVMPESQKIRALYIAAAALVAAHFIPELRAELFKFVELCGYFIVGRGLQGMGGATIQGKP